MPPDPIDFAAFNRRSNNAFDVLKADILGEQASALGHQGGQVEAAMAALRAHDAAGAEAEEARQALLKRAARAVWAYFVQREACGLRDHRQVIREYGIPGEVLVRLGVVER